MANHLYGVNNNNNEKREGDNNSTEHGTPVVNEKRRETGRQARECKKVGSLLTFCL